MFEKRDISIVKEGLKRRIALAKKNREKVIEASQKLLEKLRRREISREEYDESLRENFGDKSVNEWINYYDSYIKKCENFLNGKAEVRSKKDFGLNAVKVLPFVFLLFLIAGVLGVVYVSLNYDAYGVGTGTEGSDGLESFFDFFKGIFVKKEILLEPITGTLGIVVLSPTGDISVEQNKTFNVELEVSCVGSDCGDTDVSLEYPGLGSNPIQNGDFETGDLTGWTLSDWPALIASDSCCGGQFSLDLMDDSDNQRGFAAPSTATQNFGEIVAERLVFYEKGVMNNNGIEFVAVFIQDQNDIWVEVMRYESFEGNVDWTMESIDLGSFGVTSVKGVRATGVVEIPVPGSAPDIFLDGFCLADINGVCLENVRHFVPTTNGEKPFFVQTGLNPQTINLLQGESEIVSLEVNASGDIGTIKEFFGYAETTDQTSNIESAHWDVTIVDVVIDTSPPLIDINFPSEGGIYTSDDLPLVFNVSADEELSEIVYSLHDWLTNETFSIVDGNYIDINDSIASGDYVFKVWAKDMFGNVNRTEFAGFSFGQASTCTTLSTPGEIYVLNGDVSSSGDCFVVQAENVILDGNGFSVTGDGTGRGVLAVGRLNLTVRNVSISNFVTGVDISDNNAFPPLSQLTIVNSNLESVASNGGFNPFGNGGNGGVVSVYNSSILNITANGGVGGTDGLNKKGGNGGEVRIFGSDVDKIILVGGKGGNGAGNKDGGNGGKVLIRGVNLDVSNNVFNLNRGNGGFPGGLPGKYGVLFLNYSTSFTDVGASYGAGVNLTLINSDFGKIEWTQIIFPGGFSNIGSVSNISFNSAFVEGSVSQLNKTANIELYGFPGQGFTNPEVKKDGVSCGADCVAHTPLNAEKVRFGVLKGFSTYGIGESGASAGPVIVDISDISTQFINIGGERSVDFSVLVSDSNGFGDVVNVNATFTGPSSFRVDDLCDFAGNLDPLTANYSCSVGIWYFDEAGQWSVSASAEDSLGLFSAGYSENFVLAETAAFEHSPDGLSWPFLSPGSFDVLANEFLLLNNTGNSPISFGEIFIKAIDLVGLIDGSFIIPGGNFSVNTFSSCGGTNLVNGTSVFLPDALLPVGNNSLNTGNEFSGQETLFICVEEVPATLSQQQYSASGNNAWELNFISVIAGLLSFALPVSLSLKKRKGIKELRKKLEDDRLVEVLGEKLLEFLEVVKESNRDELRIPVSVFRTKLSPAESLCRYLKEKEGMRFSEIAGVLRRDQRSVWTNYNNSLKKEKKFSFEKGGVSIPIKIFEDRKFSVMESLVVYLKEEGFRNKDIAFALDRDQKNIWTLLSRAMKKTKTKEIFKKNKM